jgi:7-carboxy-7-deazaguanine synthase
MEFSIFFLRPKARKKRILSAQSMKITEVFYDLEGEGKYQGFPTLFIRLMGCNLRCKWCDTKYSYAGGKVMSIDELVTRAKQSPYRHINITGGEPLEQKKDVIELIKKIKRICRDKVISVETNGSISISGVPADNISMDIKLPSSGCELDIKLDNLKLLKEKDQVKLVAATKEDLSYGAEVLAKNGTKAVIIVQPVFKHFSLKEIKKFVMDNGLNWKVSVQLHKL